MAPILRPPRGSALTAKSKAIQSVLDNVAADVEALPNHALRSVAGLLRDARLELEDGLRGYLAGVEKATPFTRAQWTNALTQIRGAIQAVEDLAPEVTDLLRKSDSVAGSLAVKHVQYELNRFAQIFSHEIKPIPLLPASHLIINEGAHTRMKQYASSARRYAGALGQDIRQQIAIGMVKGETVDQMVKRLVGPGSRIKLRNLDILPDAAGPITDRIMRKYEAWGRRIVRTEVIGAYNDVAQDSIEHAHKIDGETMRRWDASLDYRSCPACAELDGVAVSMGSMFPGGIDGPPLHPNCRCSVVAWRSDWEEQGPAKIR